MLKDFFMEDICTPVTLPQMGEGVNEATLVRWIKKTGDLLEKDEPLLEVSTDKVDTEITAPEQGYLISTIHKEGEVIEVDQILGFISPDKNATPPKDLSTSAPALSKESRADTNPSGNNHIKTREVYSKPQGDLVRDTAQRQVHYEPSVQPSHAGFIRSSPMVRKMARQYGVPLGKLRGSGHLGRITKKDLLEYLEFEAPAPWSDRQGKSQVRPTEHGRTTTEESSAVKYLDLTHERFKQKTVIKDGVETLEGVVVERQAMSQMRRLTADHMIQSQAISPHVTTTFEMNLGRVSQIRAQHKEIEWQGQKLKVTYTAFFLYAVKEALKEFPFLNSSLDGTDVLLKKQINLGCAVAIEQGLIVPVIKNCNEMNLWDMAAALNDLVYRARNKKLKPDDVQGGTFSVTNPGLFGSLHSQPIINQPQVAILSVGSIYDKAMKTEEAPGFAFEPCCQVGITFDHRIVDGEGGAKFLAHIRNQLDGFVVPKLD